MIMVIAEGVKDMMPEGRSKEKGTIETELEGLHPVLVVCILLYGCSQNINAAIVLLDPHCPVRLRDLLTSEKIILAKGPTTILHIHV